MGYGDCGLKAMLTTRDGAPYDWFGRSVALGGDTALIGAWYVHNDAGAAYGFTRSAGHWSQRAALTPSTGMLGDYFGTTVALPRPRTKRRFCGRRSPFVANRGECLVRRRVMQHPFARAVQTV